jgi:hypothetical protein
MVDQRILNLGRVKFGLVNIPPTLYKFFSKPEYARAFITRGTLRLGTLYDFRRTESHDAARGDGSEGRFDYVHRSAFPEIITADNAPPHLRAYIAQTGVPIASHGGTITAQATHPDCYVFCVTSSPYAGSKGYGQYGVRIDAPAGFFGELTRHLARVRRLMKRPHGYAAPCLYGSRTSVARSIHEYIEVPIAFIKPMERAPEEEVRAVWHPTSQPIVPFITTCAKLRPFLSLM